MEEGAFSDDDVRRGEPVTENKAKGWTARGDVEDLIAENAFAGLETRG